MAEHSRLLSPSASHLWIPCTAQPQAIIDACLDRGESSEAASRGSTQHHWAEKAFLGEIDLKSTPPGDLTSEEWNEVGVAVNAALQIKETCSDKTIIFTERQVKFSGWRAECFGTADIVFVDPVEKKVIVVDYKFGRTRVNVISNPQLMIYALIVLELLGSKVEVERVFMSIIQPKISHGYSMFTCTPAHLKEWDEKTLAPAQHEILEGRGRFVIGNHCGDHYCALNKAGKCPAMNKEVDDLAAEYLDSQLQPVVTPNSSNIDFFLRLMRMEPALTQLMKAAFAVATDAAKDGEEIPGFKLVRGRKHRRFIDKAQADEFLRKKGAKKEERYESKLITPSQAHDLLTRLGKLDSPKALGAFNELIETPLGDLVLVPDTDAREAESVADIDSAVGELIGSIIEGSSDDIDSLLSGVDEDDIDAFLDFPAKPEEEVGLDEWFKDQVGGEDISF